ncbi:hypothetical protein [Sphingosinicella sp. BN140058]|uniref:hypothetical protein n=1 Tax=Sphingosinicella sp. BN140058 TaxID=1892855 RepID=UPI0010132011|nr:hypothetical protein [Sphingosinicella sp. BN140058]QAY77501.1 hypothetical protein ETR14_14050 [Sphingosinicella sp. BN140058]
MTTLFLKRILVLDAASCLGMGAILALAAAPLSGPFGLDTVVLRAAGLALLPVALFILWVATRDTLRPLPVWLVVAGNALWAAESFVLVATTPGITWLGQGFVALQALMVAGLALLEAAGALKIAPARA